ncbi:MAG: bifunctional riboflavin kinase/FAD synthetase [Rhodothermales bacterium]|nr:bifunctional riboflavin kinase/FAD synthetase [Rhodothermales bacterium]
MVEYYGIDAQPRPDSVLTVGTFDGVHRGHVTVLSKVAERAAVTTSVPTVVTFDPHPREVTSGEIVPLITTIPERIDLLAELGIARVVVIPFDGDFASIPAETYVRSVLFDSIGMREIVVGHDHAFGKGRAGDKNLLQELAGRHGFTVTELPPALNNESVISSSSIRNMLLLEGDVQRAAELLGRPYSISGTVVSGDGRGGTIGFPTANVSVGHSRKIVPLRGVYAVRVRIDGELDRLDGMMNIGFRPTFDGSGLRVEVHLFDFDDNLYGRGLQIEFVKRIREERKFDGVEGLREQLKRDRERCTAVLTGVS